VAHQGLIASIMLAAAFALVAIGVYLPGPVARGSVILAVLVAAAIWVVGQAFGAILAGGATDPNSGPLLILLALAYWPARTAAALTAWFGNQVARDARVEGVRPLSGARCAPHLVHSAAMLYMFTAVAAAGAAGTGGMGGSGMPTLNLRVLALIFAFLLIGYCVWDLDQPSR